MTQIVEAAEVARLTATRARRRDAASRPTSTSARARRRPRGSASSPPASRPATAGTTSSCPSASASCCSRSRAYLRHRDRVLSDWGYEKTVARTQGLKVLFAGESGTGKTMAAQVLAAELGLEIFRVDLATIVSQVHRGDREEPRPHLRRRRGLQRDPVLRRGRRAVRQALGGRRLARPLREHRGRLPAAEDGGLPGRGHPRDELPPQHRRRVRAPAGLRDRLPVPGGRGPPRIWELRAARRGAAAPTTSTSTSWPSSSSSPAARSATARSPPPSRPPTTTARSRCATSCAPSRRSTASRAGSRSRPTSSASTT